MPATRTQVYLTDDQRRRSDEVNRAEGVTLAEVVRRALDADLGAERDVAAALAGTFGADPTGRHPAATSGTVPDILVDTDIIIDHLRGAAELKPGRHRLHYSVIPRAGVVRGVDQHRSGRSCPRAVPGGPRVDRAIAERAGRIRRESGLRMPDALIAATALERSLGLATRDTKRFDSVRGLRTRALS